MAAAVPLLLLLSTASGATALSSPGRGFGRGNPPPSGGAFASFDRFRASCPADVAAIRRFDPSLVEGRRVDDVWVAVYRSANNLPSVFVRDAFMGAMKVSTTAQDGDSETLVSSSSAKSSSGAGVMILSSDDSEGGGAEGAKPVAVARLGRDSETGSYIMDSMRCVLKKEKTNTDCDGGSEHAEAIGVCIDELVSSYLQSYLEGEGKSGGMTFDGGIRFRGTLVSGQLLASRGFREATELSADMHSHESDYDGALASYAERSTSKEVAKNPGARDRALKIVSFLGRVDRDEDRRRAMDRSSGNSGGEDDKEDSDFDPWASVKRYL